MENVLRNQVVHAFITVKNMAREKQSTKVVINGRSLFISSIVLLKMYKVETTFFKLFGIYFRKTNSIHN